MGPAACRRLFMTGETMSTAQAMRYGMVSEVVDSADGLRKEADAILSKMSAAAPNAVAAAKRLVVGVANQPITPELMKYTANELATIRTGEEAKHGMVAVQAGKKAPWVVPLKYPTS